MLEWGVTTPPPTSLLASTEARHTLHSKSHIARTDRSLLLVRPLALLLLHVEGLFLLLQTLLLRGHHVLPEVLTRALAVRRLLRDLLGGLLALLGGVQDALALALVGDLKGGSGAEHGEGQTLGVDTGLDDLLLACQVGVAADEDEGTDNARDPGGSDDFVLLLAGPGQRAVLPGHLRQLLAA